MGATTDASSAAIAAGRLPCVATVDDRFPSYNVEMAEVIGGNFWKPYTRESVAAMTAKGAKPAPAAAEKASGTAIQVGQDPTMFQKRPPVDLTNRRLRRLGTALGPAYVRVSGTWANSVYFHDADTPPAATAPAGFQGVLTRPEWKGVVDFAHAADAKLVTSFAISPGVRDGAGVWTPAEARKLLAYTQAVGGDIAAAAMFNEPDAAAMGGAPPGYTAADYARDFAVFKSFVREAAPQMQIVGPGSVGEGGALTATGMVTVTTAAMLAATPRPAFDVYSYHSYAAASIRCVAVGPAAQTTANAALSEEWLARPDAIYAYHARFRDRYAPGKPTWITETADAACGGNPWASTFLDTFRYLDQCGRLAKRGVQVIFHNTLASSEYGLLDQKSFAPRPNYWGALLWRRLMGAVVLDAGPSQPGLHLYAQSLPGHPGGVTLLAINNSRTQSASVAITVRALSYTLTARRLEDGRVRLNGRELRLGVGDALPSFAGAHVRAGTVRLAPASITFLAMPDAGNPNCP